MGPPENPLLSDEDREDEDFINPDINHLCGNQIRATTELHAKHLQDTGILSTIMGEEDIPEEYLENVNTPDNENKHFEILNICDNLTLDENDKFGKVRPLWLLLNKRWLHVFPKDANVSIDEAMAPYYGRRGAKQHIHGKPIRFGYKVWCLCSRLGYLVPGEPYQGASTENTHPELGVGGSVVIDLVDKSPHGQYSIYIDNLFTSVRLLEELKSKGHYCTVTIRSNRIEKASLEEAFTLKKKVKEVLTPS
uniref:PiggyBac transposable element-derived protein domain-containing protein n=1 Tax=Timema douglasi TaxID=61478 RepID=A0A7R8Z4A0_TIMDO|nr:unnamed protein product [Timema douglasi]